ncbi:MAG: hypothetical protein JOS17DRAFT_94558 [Linnemannia elongata]|nr:MAG: hypothetical protein JOS17DRAFT_94558 [Linnemannia elongata]
MSRLRVRDVFLSSNDFDPRQAVEPYPMSGEERVWKRKLSGDEFRSFWYNERVAVQFEYRSEGGGGRDIKTDSESMDKELPVFKGVPGARGAPKKYDWTFRFRCRRHRPRKQLGIGRESVGNNCPAQIRMKKLVSCDVVEVEYEWCHNHADSAQARSKLPLDKNELEWTKAKIASGQDWKAVRSQLRLSKEALDLLEDQKGQGPIPPCLYRLYDDVRTVAYRQKTQGSRKSQDVAVSVKLWLDLIVQGGGKSMFMDQVAEFPEHFVFAWCTKFQLRLGHERQQIHCMYGFYS